MKEKKSGFRGKNGVIYVISGVILILILAVMGYSYLFMAQERAYLRQYEAVQQEETDYLRQLIESSSNSDEMISRMKDCFEVSGSRWDYLIEDDKVIFAQNDTTTAGLGQESAHAGFDKYLGTMKLIRTESSFENQGQTYIIGIVTNKDYALDRVSIPKYRVYFVLFTFVLALLFSMGLVYYAGSLDKCNQKIEQIREELIKRNDLFAEYEADSNRKQEMEESLNKPVQEIGYYDWGFLKTLLEKSNQKQLFPISFLYIQIVMEARYYTKDELMSVMDYVKDALNGAQVIAEISKGKFAAVLYKTSLEEAQQLTENLYAGWGEKGENLPLLIKPAFVSEGDSPMETFLKHLPESFQQLK